jgi:RimJ/RimL family protein N-acetyltransferase
VHDPAEMPFFSEWTDGDPDTVARRVLQRHWSAAATWTPDDWTLYMVVVHDGLVVGSQSIGARAFSQLREVQLTSWLGRQFQGQGIGTHARAAMLALAFDGLRAEFALSVVQRSNVRSQGVIRRFGFASDGVQANVVRGRRVVSDRYRLDRATWESNAARIPVTVEGVGACMHLFEGDSRPQVERPPPAASAASFSGIQLAAESDQAAD